MDDSHQHNVEGKKPKKQTDGSILYDAVYIKLKTGKTNLFGGRTQGTGTFVHGGWLLRSNLRMTLGASYDLFLHLGAS